MTTALDQSAVQVWREDSAGSTTQGWGHVVETAESGAALGERGAFAASALPKHACAQTPEWHGVRAQRRVAVRLLGPLHILQHTP